MLTVRTLLFFLLTCFCSLLTAQELSQTVIGSAGGYFSAPGGGNLHFTVGEIAVARTENGPVLERGFHHGLSSETTTSTWSARRSELKLAAFPNPTDGAVTLTGDWLPDDRLEVRDVFGRVLLQRTAGVARETVDLSSYPAGTYILTLTRAGRPLAGARLVRR